MTDISMAIADEELIIGHSGEMPEVGYHGSIYFLTQDEDGPQLTLTESDMQPLKQAVVKQYCKIIMRDLTPENRCKTIYRGLQRCVINWERLKLFCERENIDISKAKKEISLALHNFLKIEIDDVCLCGQETTINCCAGTLNLFLGDLGICCSDFEKSLKAICPLPE